jgi:hypothetical protein
MVTSGATCKCQNLNPKPKPKSPKPISGYKLNFHQMVTQGSTPKGATQKNKSQTQNPKTLNQSQATIPLGKQTFTKGQW